MKASTAMIVGMLVTLSGAAACSNRAVAQSEATTQPAATQPASADDPQVDAWLDRIEQKAQQIRTFQADVRYERVQPLVGDKQTRLGRLVYEAGPPAKVAVHLDRIVVDNARRPLNEWWIFDGVWLVERHGDERRFIKRQVVDPQQRDADPLALGSGPFAVPLNARKQEVLRRFNVELIESAQGDPADALHLRLTPRSQTKADFTVADLWYHRDTLLPLRVRSVDDSESVSLIDLAKPQVNEPVDVQVFNTTPPAERGWLVEITPLD